MQEQEDTGGEGSPGRKRNRKKTRWGGVGRYWNK